MHDRLQSAGVSPEIITQIGSWLESHSCQSEAGLKPLKAQYPELVFTLCSEDDMGFHEPWHSFSYFDLHLVAHNLSGCSSLTPSPEMCSGLVIALHEE
ncbi:hypothetical protein [Vibrio quintilis]|uniref:Uncharacterized protein n=1 Tax=Vibrio quintilis TaxID=1117707 RepID=A0A1M7YW70_9VIBR|nr:hypothetical protein [Vibrio quintilis]SHO56815.1 hypothetical protein VQ7734_02584 [Vibrio quintilis]